MINELEQENTDLKNKLVAAQNELTTHKVRYDLCRKRRKHKQARSKRSWKCSKDREMILRQNSSNSNEKLSSFRTSTKPWNQKLAQPTAC